MKSNREYIFTDKIPFYCGKILDNYGKRNIDNGTYSFIIGIGNDVATFIYIDKSDIKILIEQGFNKKYDR